MNESTRDDVRNRAGNRCEYCLLHQDDSPLATHHIEHVVPIKRDHFEWHGITIVGKTAIERTTVRVLNMNSDDQLNLRTS